MEQLFAFDVRVARAVGDVGAAVYFTALEARAFGSVVTITADAMRDIRAATSLSAEAQRQARARLAGIGVVDSKPDAAKRNVVVRLNRAVLDGLIIAAEARTPDDDAIAVEKAQQVALPLDGVSVADILAGVYDGAARARWAKTDWMIRALLDLWATTWGHRPAQIKPTKERLSAFRRAFIDEKRAPSELAKAILGMAEDDWSDRAKYSEIAHVVKHLEKWVRLYDDVERGDKKSKRSHATTASKTVKGTLIPADYQWTSADDVAAGSGLRFDFATRKWASQ